MNTATPTGGVAAELHSFIQAEGKETDLSLNQDGQQQQQDDGAGTDTGASTDKGAAAKDGAQTDTAQQDAVAADKKNDSSREIVDRMLGRGKKTDTADGKDKDAQQQQQAGAEDKEIPSNIRDLRQGYSTYKKQVEELTRERDALKSRKPEDNGELKTYKEQLEVIRKEKEELERTVKTTDYTNSSEFKEKYVAPIQKAFQAVKTDLKGIKITDPDTGTEREANLGDFEELLAMNTAEAARKAGELFGEDMKPEIMAHRRSMLQLQDAAREAKRSAPEHLKRLQAENEAKTTQHNGRIQQVVTDVHRELEKAMPEIFSKEGDDKEGIAELEKGWNLVKAVFGLPENSEERAEVAAVVMARAAGFDRQALMLKSARSEIAALQEKLSAYEQSDPTKGGNRSTATTRGGGAKPAARLVDELGLLAKEVTHFAP